MPEQAYEWIEYKVVDGVATITFNAPQFNNALGLKGLQEFSMLFIAPRPTTPSVLCWSPGEARPSGRVQPEGNSRQKTSTSKKSPLTFACWQCGGTRSSSVHPYAETDPAAVNGVAAAPGLE